MEKLRKNLTLIIIFTIIAYSLLGICNINSYAKIKLQIPNTVDEKNLVIYNLTTQKTVSYEVSDDYAVCELNSLGEIALFNNRNVSNEDNNLEESSNSINIITIVLIGSNILLGGLCIVIAFISKSKKKKLLNDTLSKTEKN